MRVILDSVSIENRRVTTVACGSFHTLVLATAPDQSEHDNSGVELWTWGKVGVEGCSFEGAPLSVPPLSGLVCVGYPAAVMASDKAHMDLDSHMRLPLEFGWSVG